MNNFNNIDVYYTICNIFIIIYIIIIYSMLIYVYLWVQIPLRPTFYSYFKESISGEYHMYHSFRYTHVTVELMA